MLAELKRPVLPSYPKPVLPSYKTLLKRYLRTRDFYDLPIEVENDACLYRDKDEPERLWMAKRHPRLIIYPKDLEAIYGKKGRTCRRYLQEIRESKGLPKGAPVTIQDFCAETGLDYQTIHDFIMES